MPAKRSTRQTSKTKQTDPDSGEDYDPLNLSDSEEESEIIKPLKRMTISKQTKNTNTTTMDPPRNGNGPRALVRTVDMKSRDTDVYLRTILVQREHGILLIIDKLAGVNPEDIHLTRCMKNKKQLTLEWDSTIGAVKTIHDLFCSGNYQIGSELVNLLPTDAFVQDMAGAVKEIVGSQRNQIQPKTRYSVVLDYPVKPTPSPIKTTLQTGESICVYITLLALLYYLLTFSVFGTRSNC